MRGRQAEREAIERLVASARDGRSAVLLVRGEAGMGKTSLLEHAQSAGDGFRVLRTVGVEAEGGFVFAGLHRLCAPVLDHLDALPAPQRTALSVALGRESGERPDPFLVGLATLSLLAETSAERPLLCLVDDAQWLDTISLQTIAFAARRLEAEPVALVVALREPARGEPGRVLAGLPDLTLSGLPDADARALLSAEVRAPLDDTVRDRIVAEARGNPLALRELARHAGPAGLAGGFGLPDALSVPERIEEEFRRQAADLPPAARLALLVAAAEPTGDLALFWRAATRLGIEALDAETAQAGGLLDLGTRVRFAHPLARSAVYRAAAPADRRRVHAAIASATDATTGRDRRTWHEAQAVLGTDEQIAADLQLAAGRARALGGPGAAAVFLERSAELTPDPAGRAARTLDAAFAKHEAGAAAAALDLLAVATAGPLDALRRARAELLRARVVAHTSRGNEALGPMLGAAALLAPLDAELSRDTYLDAVDAAMMAGRFARGGGVVGVAEAALGAPAPPAAPRPADLLLDGLVAYHLRGYAAAVPALRHAQRAFAERTPGPADGTLRRRWLACHTAMALWDDTLLHTLAADLVEHARRAGEVTSLPIALNFQAAVLVHAGEPGRVADLLDEADGILGATRGAPIVHTRLIDAAWRGDRDEALALSRTSVEAGTRRGEGTALSIADYALAVLHNGLGDHTAALEAAERARDAGEMVHASLALPELVEAAVRCGRPGRAAGAVAELESQARATGSPWALGVAARCRALTTDGADADDLFRESVAQLSGTRMRAHLARTRLLYGEHLRREGRRRDAREQLRAAHEQLSLAGPGGFAARAAAELRVTGEHPRTRAAQPVDNLTAQELRIARLVATGATSKEAGARLFLSPRTVDAHLRSIFPKLGITSRRQLRDVDLG
ncbi:MAG: AAA family ATPase [Promicromonosporaceae bacterium]|nr:AAA family ATPase [Promicromonosporaceae bacterium]